MEWGKDTIDGSIQVHKYTGKQVGAFPHDLFTCLRVYLFTL